MSQGDKRTTGSMYDRPGFLLRRAHQISVSIFEAQCEHLDATPAQIAALSMVRDHPLLNQSELARAIGLDRATVSVLVKALAARGLLQRQRRRPGCKLVTMTLTQEGRSVLARAQAPSRQADQVLTSPFSTEERDLFVGLLLRLVADLEPHARAPLAKRPGRQTGATTFDGDPESSDADLAKPIDACELRPSERRALEADERDPASAHVNTHSADRRRRRSVPAASPPPAKLHV